MEIAKAAAENTKPRNLIEEVGECDAPSNETEMLETARVKLEMLREALGVSVEPHQTLFDRMIEAAKCKSANARDAELLDVLRDEFADTDLACRKRAALESAGVHGFETCTQAAELYDELERVYGSADINDDDARIRWRNARDLCEGLIISLDNGLAPIYEVASTTFKGGATDGRELRDATDGRELRDAADGLGEAARFAPWHCSGEITTPAPEIKALIPLDHITADALPPSTPK